jgi:hypothetical protein
MGMSSRYWPAVPGVSEVLFVFGTEVIDLIPVRNTLIEDLDGDHPGEGVWVSIIRVSSKLLKSSR